MRKSSDARRILLFCGSAAALCSGGGMCSLPSFLQRFAPGAGVKSQMEEKTGGNGDFTQRCEKHAISSNISSVIFLQMFPP